MWGCVKSISPPAAAEFSFETDVFFLALRAKLSFERHLIFEISLREISKMRCLSK